MIHRTKEKVKRMCAILLSAVMVLAMGTTVFAAGGEQGTITINDDTGNIYTVYKVANATKEGNDSSGNPIYTYALTDEFETFFADGANGYLFSKTEGITTADGTPVSTDGRGNNTNVTEASRLASALEKYARDNSVLGTKVKGQEGVALEYGYYVIAETESAEGTAVASKPILIDLRDAALTIEPKDDDIDIEKKIDEENGPVDANNVSIGDEIPFVVNTSIPKYEANVDRTKLKYVLTDTFTNMDFVKESFVLKINNVEMTEGTDYTLESTETGFTVTLTQDTIFNHQGEIVTLNYKAILNENAVVDSPDGNPNNIRLDYTNNPNQDDSFDTIEDETKTYTYGFKLHKVDKYDDQKSMAGAEFEVKDANDNVIGTIKYGEDGKIETTGPVITVDGNYAVLSGLDAGTYTLTETKAPDGYALLADPVHVTIKDVGEEEGGLPSGVAKIEVSGPGIVEGNATDDGNGTIGIGVKVENVKGISLPETGAKTALYCMIGGGILLVLGGVYFGLSRRSRHSK